MLGLSDVFNNNGSFKPGGPQCDAADSMLGWLDRLAVEERALEGFDAYTSRRLVDELFSFHREIAEALLPCGRMSTHSRFLLERPPLRAALGYQKS